MLTELARLQADCADIKAALRCASVGKSEEFILNTLSGYGLLDKKTLTAAALAGVQELCSYVDSVALYSPLAEALKESSTAFERKCDDLMIKVVEKDRLSAFGVEPIAAYYISKTAELKNVRIILNCKLNAVEANEIRGRVRML